MPSRYLIAGNSGSGKTTLAKQLCAEHCLAHLDLDSVAWDPESPTTRRSIEDSMAEIEDFLVREARWVIEGCYADLLGRLSERADALCFLNPGVEVCVQRCRERPWEAHKYRSKAEQDRNLEFLIAWVREYPTREGPMSLRAHLELFERFQGDKLELNE